MIYRCFKDTMDCYKCSFEPICLDPVHWLEVSEELVNEDELLPPVSCSSE